MEEQRLLRNVGNLTAKALLGAVAHVLPVHQHAPLLHVIQAQEELGERGLARAGAAHQANTLACGNVKVEVLKDVVVLGCVRIAEAQVLEVDASLGHLKRLCVLVVCHERGLVQHARHLGSVAKGTVDALHHGVEVVEAHCEVIRVGEHHDQRAGTNAKPGIAAHHKDRDHKHDGSDERRRSKAATHGCTHVDVLGRHCLAICRCKEPALVVLTAVGLDGKDVGHGIGEHAGELVLGARRLCREGQNAPVHAIGNDHVEHKHHHEDGNKERRDRRENAHREHDGGKRWPQRVRHHVNQAGVTRDKPRGLAHQAAAKAAVVERHRLVGECVKAQARELVVTVDLQLVD